MNNYPIVGHLTSETSKKYFLETQFVIGLHPVIKMTRMLSPNKVTATTLCKCSDAKFTAGQKLDHCKVFRSRLTKFKCRARKFASIGQRCHVRLQTTWNIRWMINSFLGKNWINWIRRLKRKFHFLRSQFCESFQCLATFRRPTSSTTPRINKSPRKWFIDFPTYSVTVAVIWIK